MMRWAHPSYLWWLLLIPFFFWFFVLMTRQKNKRMQKFFEERIYLLLIKSLDPSKRLKKVWMQLFVLALIVLGLARLQIGGSQDTIKSAGLEIIFAVDVSESMLADDLKPNRLELAKIDLQRLIDLMPGSKFGLVAFAGSASLISPLTNDPAAMKMYIESLSTNSISNQGTSIESAMDVSLQAFARGGQGQEDTLRVTQVVVLLSDGEDHEPGALEKAQIAKDKNIKIYSWAYGTEKGAAIPVRDNFGFLKGYKKDRSGQVILSTVKGEELKKIAEATGGLLFFASPGSEYVKQMFNTLDALEKTTFESQVSVNYLELFQWFLAAALGLAMWEHLTGERRKEADL